MQCPFRVLIADDDPFLVSACQEIIARQFPGAQIDCTEDPDDCLRLARANQYSVVLLDISFGPADNEGLSLLPEITRLQRFAKIFMFTGFDDRQTILQCHALGATDFISKNDGDLETIASVLRGHVESEAKQESDASEGQRIAAAIGAVFSSQAMTEVFTRVAYAQRHRNIPVLITGETGVGKDVVAMAIAAGKSPRLPITVDCGAIPETLAESELFGHVRGAFTGADEDKSGKFALADKSDLFLDEIGNLKRSIQDKLLRAIQSREITPIGANRPVKIDTRIIAATNEDLESMVAAGRFRQDLLERLKGIWITVPPLRDRPEDISPIVDSILAESSKPHLKVAPSCLSLLQSYSWPGNVRELKHVVREMVGSCERGPITSRHLPAHFRQRLSTELAAERACHVTPMHVPGAYHVGLTGTLFEAESGFLAQYIQDRYRCLKPTASKRALAAALGISRNTLDVYIKRLGINLDADDYGQVPEGLAATP